jgi:hypothetical protein
VTPKIGTTCVGTAIKQSQKQAWNPIEKIIPKRENKSPKNRELHH